MNFKLTMTLTIVLLLVLSGFLLLKKQADQPDKPAGPTPLLAIAPKEITKITYIRDGNEELAFTKSGDNWVMSKPANATAERFSVQGIADDLQSMSYRQKFEPEPTGNKSANATGTERPRNLVKYTDDTGRETTLAFGKATVDGVYATLNGAKTVYLLDKNPVPSLQQEPDKFRNKTVKETDIAKITSLTVATPDNKVSLTKSGEQWLVTAPISARANQATVNEVINEFRAIRANAFSTLDKNTAGLNNPAVTVTAYVNDAPPSTAPASATSQPAVGGGKPITLQIGLYTDLIKKNFVWASLADSNEVFTLRADSFNKLNRELKDLRDTAITPSPVANATELTVSAPNQPTVTATKKEGKWSITAPVAVDGDTFAIGDFLGVIRDLRAIRFVDNAGNLSSIGLDPPQMKIELTLPGQTQHEVILVGKPETDDKGGKVTPLMRQGEPTVYLVQSADADRLVASPIAFRDKTVAALKGDQIRSIDVKSEGAGNANFTLERDGSNWKVKSGAAEATPADDSKVTSLLADLTPLTAAKYLDAVPPTTTPAVTVTISILESTIAPSTAPSTIPAAPAMGPDPGKITTHTLKLYQQAPAATAPGTAPATNAQPTWKAFYDGQSPAWTFQPNEALVTHLTKETYAAASTTKPATAPAPIPGQP